ncbi:MAG: GHKL domain-containing protein [Bacteroidetes bacterium]|nr:GHKL domain-containing protein [Bacteroidota bacterium]
MSVVGAVASYIHVKTQEEQLLDTMILGAEQLSGSITSATWHAMLADQRESAYQTMETIAKKQGIDRIRIFNKEGRIMFSTVPNDTGSVDKATEACFMCHNVSQPLVKVDVPTRTRVYHSSKGIRRLGMITPIYNEHSCSSASCHAHPAFMSVLGVLDVSLDLTAVDQEMSAIRIRVIIITIAIVVIMSLYILYFSKNFVDAPIAHLIEGTRAVSQMQLDTPVVIESSEELGELAESFDIMRLQLKSALDEINQFTLSLETKVEERTEQLKAAHQKLLKSDRLASLGQLSASVAHEINNPLSGVLNLSMLLQRIIKDDGIPKERVEDFKKFLSQIINETARVGRIVQDLLAFSRQSKPHRSQFDINMIVKTTASLIQHKLKLMEVTNELHLEEKLPLVSCDGSQIQQVVMNLVMNAAEACQNKLNAKVIISTASDADLQNIYLAIQDNGDGISEENLTKIFTPFFTTKGDGKGVGLGLAVVYGIVESHKGEINVESKVGEGTTFTVRIPIAEEPQRIIEQETTEQRV